MASMPSMSQKKEEFKEEFLTCSICAEPFDNHTHVAKCLPCLHSFCKSCLLRHANSKLTLDCPKCRKTVPLQAKGDLDSLPNNFIVENLKEYQDIFNLAVACGNCDEGESALSFCHDCGCFVCQLCVDSHQRMRTLRLHTLSTLAELQEKKCNPLTKCQQRCQKHPKHELTLYCQEETCKMPACATCAHVDHRGHDLKYIEEAAVKTALQLKAACSRVKNQYKVLEDNQSSIRKAQRSLKTSYRQKQQEVQGTVDELHRLIDTRCASAKAQLEDLFNKEMERLEHKDKMVETLSSQMSSACKYTESACSVSHPVQLLDSSERIMERLLELQNLQLPPTEMESKQFEVTEKHSKSMSKFKESLKNLCELSLVEGLRGDCSENSTKTDKCPPQTERSSKVAKESSDTLKHPSKDVNLVDPTKCSIVIDETPCRGQVCNAIITTVDSNNQPICQGGAKVQAFFKWSGSLIEGAPCFVEDHGNGTYTVTFVPLFHGRNELSVSINDSPIQGSPFSVDVLHEKC